MTPPPLPHSLSCSPLFIAALNVLVGVSRAHHLVVHAVTYQGIANEWLDWLRGVVDPEAEAEEYGQEPEQEDGAGGDEEDDDEDARSPQSEEPRDAALEEQDAAGGDGDYAEEEDEADDDAMED